MTKEELSKVPFTPVSHLNMEHEHTSTYVNADYDFGMCSHTKCIDGIACGRIYTQSLKMLLEAIKDVEFKG